MMLVQMCKTNGGSETHGDAPLIRGMDNVKNERDFPSDMGVQDDRTPNEGRGRQKGEMVTPSSPRNSINVHLPGQRWILRGSARFLEGEVLERKVTESEMRMLNKPNSDVMPQDVHPFIVELPVGGLCGVRGILVVEMEEEAEELAFSSPPLAKVQGKHANLPQEPSLQRC